MDVQVDDPRHDVPAGGVDLVVARLGTVLGVLHRQTGRSGTLDLLDPVALDDDVDRAERWRTGAVDHRHATDHQPIERADTFVLTPVGGRNHRRFFFLGRFLLAH